MHMIRIAIAILLACIAYTLLRYVVFGPIATDQIPAFLLNKAVSMASVTLLFGAAVSHRRGLPDQTHFYGMAALQAGYVHLILSLAMLSKAYYPTFFTQDTMSMRGQLAIGSGVLGAYGFWLIRYRLPTKSIKIALQALSSLAVAGHLVAMDSIGWSDATNWHGGLPPISLIGFLLAAVSGILFLLSIRGDEPAR